MALSIGTLAGYLELDDSKFERGLDAAKGNFAKAGDWMKSHGKQIGAAAGVAVGSALAVGIAKNVEFSAGRAKLQGQLGLSTKDAQKAGKTAGKLYAGDFAGSMDEANDAIKSVVQNMNVSVNDVNLEPLSAKALTVAKTFEQDLGMTTAAVGQLMKTGMAKDANEAFDIITVGLQGPANKADDLLETFNEYGTQFRKLGLDGKDAVSLLSQGLQGGARDADIVADSLKEFAIRTQESLEQTDSKGRRHLTELGGAFIAAGYDTDSMYEAQERLAKGGKGARDTFDVLLTGLKKIKDPVQRNAAAVALFGTQAEDMGGALFALDLDKPAKGLDKLKGATDRVSDAVGSTAQSKITGMKNKVELWTSSLIEADGPLGMVAAGTAAFGGSAVSTLGPLVGMIAAVRASRAATAAATAATNAGTVAQGRGRIATVATMAVSKGAALATRGWAIAQRLLNLAMANNPIGWTIKILMLLGGALVLAYKKSETFRRIVDGAWAGIKRGISAAWNNVILPIFKLLKWWYVDVLFGAAKKLARGMRDAWENIKDKTRSAVLFVADKALWMAEKLLGVFAKLPGKLGAPFRAALAKVREFRKDVNGEMDAIRDENVRISLTTIRSAAANNEKRLGPARGGAGRIPRGAVGGMGLIPQVSGNLSGARAAATSTAATRHKIAMAAAEGIQNKLVAAHKKAQAKGLGAPGAAGRVLPRGSYSIGMPYHGYPGHNGADYPAATGTPVYAPWAGRVTASYDLPGSNAYNGTPYRSYGRVVKIAYANGMSSLFAHLSSRIARTGPIAAGTMVGRVGMNGNATGPHLHAEFNGGRTNPATLGLFDHGGLARGAGLMVKGPKPERVLSNRQTEAFEQLVHTLQDGDIGGPKVHAPISVTMPATSTPESAGSAAGGRIADALSALGI